MKHLTAHLSTRVKDLKINLLDDGAFTWGYEISNNFFLRVRNTWFKVTTPEEIDAVLRFVCYKFADEITVYEPVDAARLAFFTLGLKVQDPAFWASPEGVVVVRATDKEFEITIKRGYDPQQEETVQSLHLDRDGHRLHLASILGGLESALSHWLPVCYDMFHLPEVLYEIKDGILHTTPTAHYADLIEQ